MILSGTSAALCQLCMRVHTDRIKLDENKLRKKADTIYSLIKNALAEFFSDFENGRGAS
jgi:uncharacterized protein YbcI